MAGPWEDYQSAAQPSGPWNDYSAWQPKRRGLAEIRAEGAAAGQHDPTQGMSSSQLALAGAGKSLVDTYRGAQQLGARVADTVDPLAHRSAAINATVNDQRRTDAALMNTTAGQVGNIAGQVGQMLIPIPGAAGVKAAQMFGKAAPWLLDAARAGMFGATQATADGESHVRNAAVNAGLALGGRGLTAGLGRAAQAAEPAIDVAKQQAVALLTRLGVPLHASQTLDSGFLKLVSSVANKMPFSGVQKAGEAQKQAFNHALGESMGTMGVNKLTDDVIRQTTRRESNFYDKIFGRNTVKLTPDVMNNLGAIAQQARTDLTPDKAQVVINQIGKFIDKAAAGGEIPGRAYQQIRLGMKALESNPESGHMVRQVRYAMQDAANKSFTGSDAQLLARTNGRWANKKVIEAALKQVDGAANNVNPAALWRIVGGPHGSTPAMRELARAGQLVLKNGVPDSGTAQREMAERMMGYKGIGPFLSSWGTAPAGATVGRVLNSPTAARILPGAGAKVLRGASRALRSAPKLLPALQFPALRRPNDN